MRYSKSIWVALTLLTIIGIAGSIRFSRLFTLPSGVWIDESKWSLNASHLIQGDLPCCPLYFEEPSGGHPLYAYLTAVAQIMGAPTPFSGRITAAIIGIITVTLSFWVYRTFARSLFPEPEVAWVSLYGTFALAILFAHVTWSRAGMEGITLSMFSLIIVWATWLAFDQRSYRWAVIAGTALGLSQYTYVAAQAMIALVLLYAAVRAIHARHEKGRLTSVLRMSMVIFIMAAVIYAPLAITILREPDQFFTQIRGTSVGTFSGDIYTVGHSILVNV